MNISIGESQVMEVLWRRGSVSTEEIVEAVGPANGWAESTVKTLIHRLLKKKAIAGAKAEGRYLYRPLIARADYVQAESKGLIDRLFGGQIAPMVHHFAEHGALTPEEIERLKALIAEVEKKHG
jgi:predicted transcriptional regulator